MDKPKINLKAWEPIEKRKNKDFNKENTYQPVGRSKKNIYEMIDNRVNHSDYREKRNSAEEEEKGFIYKTGEYKLSPYNDRDYSPRYNIEIDERLYKKKKKNRSRSQFKFRGPILKTIGAGIGAIATGMVFGYILLYYFVEPMLNVDHTITNTTNSSVMQKNNPVATGKYIGISEQVIYLIQAGVFSEQSSAEKMVSEQKKLGRAAMVAGNGPFYVYIGIAKDKETGLKLKESLVGNGTDLYVKAYTLPNYQGSLTGQELDYFNRWFNSGDSLVKELANQSQIALVQSNDPFQYDKLQKLHQDFLIDAQGLKASLSNLSLNQEQDIIQKMTDSLNYSMSALNAYKKNPNPQYLWNIQELLMKYDFDYVQLSGM